MDISKLYFWQPFIECWIDFKLLTIAAFLICLVMAVICSYAVLRKKKIREKRYSEDSNIEG